MIKPGSSPLLKKFYGSRWALLVGVNRYTDAAISCLKVCASDVQAVYDLLTANGYEPGRMRLLLSPGKPNPPATRVEVLAALTSVAQAAGEGDLLLFYFSGHGIHRDGQAYLLPADTRYAAVADTAVDLDRVKQIIQESAAQAKVIILDACHSGAQIGKAPPGMTEEFVRHVFEEAEGIAILASCKQKQVSWEWHEKGQSVFTHYLLEGLRGTADFDEKGFVTVGDINRYVTDRVKTWAVQRSRVQTPTLHYTVAGDIVLVAHSSATNTTLPVTTLITADELNLDTVEFKDVGETSVKRSKETPMHRESAVPTITWLHLSDFHFRASETCDSNIVLNALLRDVAERIHDDHLQPDFIIISGDIAFASHPDEYVLAQRFLDDLLKTTGLSKDCLFIVPGNHDVDRSVISPLAAGATAILNNRDAVNRFLANDADRTLVFQRFHHYQNFINEYLGKEHLPLDNTRYFYVKHIEVADLWVAILGLNSAWLSASDADRNQLVLGERQVRAALEAAEDADLRLAVMHHPFEWLQDSDRNGVEPLLRDGCTFVLHGHLHQVALFQTRTPDDEALVIAAGACYGMRQHSNSYNFVQLNLNTGKGTAYLRMYSDQRGGFWTKDVVNYRNVKDGTYTFSFPGHLCPNQTNMSPLKKLTDPGNDDLFVPTISHTPPVLFEKDLYDQLRKSEIAVHLRDWKIVHSTVQNLLFGTEPFINAFEQFEKQTSDSNANEMEKKWLRYCEPKTRRIRQSFVDLPVAGHPRIQELLSLLQGKDSVIAAIQYLKVDDAQSIRQLQSSIYALVDTLKEVLILADIHIVQTAEHLILTDNKSSR